MSWLFRRRVAELDAREADLNRREDAIFERENRLALERADLLNVRADLEEQKRKQSVMVTHDQYATSLSTIDGYAMKTATIKPPLPRIGPLGANYDDLCDSDCAQCGREATCISYKVYWAETRRVRKKYLCSDECAYTFDEEQRALVDGEAYVRRSLGVPE